MRSKHILTFILISGCLLLILGIYSVVNGYVKAKNQNSWLPGEALSFLTNPTLRGKDEIIVNGPFFTIVADQKGAVRIYDLSDTMIVSNMLYYASPDLIDEKYGLENCSLTQVNDSALLITGSGLNGAEVLIRLIVSQRNPCLKFKIETTYRAETEVAREALLVSFDIPVEEVYKRNGTIDIQQFANEYWLNRQGVRFGNKERQALIYHTPGISSLQLDHSGRMLSINLEYAYDHPYVHFPYQEDNAGRWVDRSSAIFPKDYVRADSLTIWFGGLPAITPRLLRLPYGYLAGYIFTEHADGGILERHRAVYFGSDTIITASNATGGFYGNKIPVTKSLFYINMEEPGLYTAIKNSNNDSTFLFFLQQLNSTDCYDLCLHTPENNNSDRETMREATAFMRDNFNSVTWIDHGMLGGRNNRECFHSDGFDEESMYYVADIWDEFGLKYFWNTAFELKEPYIFATRDALRQGHFSDAFRCFWNNFYPPSELIQSSILQAATTLRYKLKQDKLSRVIERYRDEALPLPLFWLHPTRTGPFYSWGTYFVDITYGLWLDSAIEEFNARKSRLEELIKHRMVFISHGYYVRGIPEIDITSEQNGRVEINPYFEDILRYMSKRRDEGDLFLTTIKDLLDYQLLLENIEFNYQDDNIIITNHNTSSVHGLSLALRNAGATVEGKATFSKSSDEDFIIWFDILAGESVTLKITPDAKPKDHK